MATGSYWDKIETTERDLQDALDAGTVEILVSHAGKFWINIDGKCALRIGKVKEVVLDAPLVGQRKVWPKPDFKKPKGT